MTWALYRAIGRVFGPLEDRFGVLSALVERPFRTFGLVIALPGAVICGVVGIVSGDWGGAVVTLALGFGVAWLALTGAIWLQTRNDELAASFWDAFQASNPHHTPPWIEQPRSSLEDPDPPEAEGKA
jgi:hypothetical protein